MAGDTLSCKICFEYYDVAERKPKILSACGHTFCLHCVTELFARDNSPDCPMCRKCVGQRLFDLKDNYELMDLLSLEKSTSAKFWCNDCKMVASRLCFERHPIKSLAVVVAENTLKAKANLGRKVNEENAILLKVKDMLKSTINAVENCVMLRLQSELDACQKRIEELAYLSDDIDTAQRTAARNGDFSLLKVFDELDNSHHCCFLREQTEVHSRAKECKLTLSLTDGDRTFSVGESAEDKVLAYLLSILLQQPLKTTKPKGCLKDDSMAKSQWAASPWLTKWNQIENDQNEHGSVHLSDSESVISDVSERNKNCHEVYVCGIKQEYASYKILKDIFSNYATVLNARILKSKKKGMNPWCAFIEFNSEDSVSHVLSLKNSIERKFELQVRPKLMKQKGQPTKLLVKSSERQRSEAIDQKPTNIADDQESNDLCHRMLFIQNVPVEFPEHRISEALSKFGAVQDVRKSVKPVPGMKPRAFAFITFVYKSSVQKALSESVKRVYCAQGVSLEYRAYHKQTNNNLNKDITSNSNSSSSCASSVSKVTPGLPSQSVVNRSALLQTSPAPLTSHTNSNSSGSCASSVPKFAPALPSQSVVNRSALLQTPPAPLTSHANLNSSGSCASSVPKFAPALPSQSVVNRSALLQTPPAPLTSNTNSNSSGSCASSVPKFAPALPSQSVVNRSALLQTSPASSIRIRMVVPVTSSNVSSSVNKPQTVDRFDLLDPKPPVSNTTIHQPSSSFTEVQVGWSSTSSGVSGRLTPSAPPLVCSNMQPAASSQARTIPNSSFPMSQTRRPTDNPKKDCSLQ